MKREIGRVMNKVSLTTYYRLRHVNLSIKKAIMGWLLISQLSLIQKIITILTVEERTADDYRLRGDDEEGNGHAEESASDASRRTQRQRGISRDSLRQAQKWKRLVSVSVNGNPGQIGKSDFYAVNLEVWRKAGKRVRCTATLVACGVSRGSDKIMKE